MNLFIVESPAKAKTIGQYLGKDFEVIASIGHIRELLQNNDGVDVNNDFKLNYQIIDKAKSQVSKICSLAKNATKIYLASDPDREGEAIAQSLYEVLIAKKVAKSDQFLRITYTEITKTAIQEALKNPRKIDSNLVDAQQSRQTLDYLVGFNLSPVLWRKLPGSKSAGRVQSVALRMIVDREFEIKKFKPEEYWTINCDLNTSKNESVNTRVIKFNDNNFDVNFPKDEKTTEEICKIIKNTNKFKVVKNEKKDVKQNPYPPFTTALLQQDAVRKLGFSSKKTMSLAQKLYEGVQIKGKTIALITYMRTDGMTLSNDALKSIRSEISVSFGNDYLPEKSIIYKTKSKNAQEAHEAIRPTHIDIKPMDIKNDIENDMWRLYDLIWKRTIACQMKPAIYSRQTIDLELKDDKNIVLSRINGSQLKFNGYLAVYNIKNEAYEAGDEDNEDKIIPDIKVNDILSVNEVLKDQHFTNPPARYSEASLIKALEAYGIGRPSTYATIISVLQDREYVVLEKRQFTPTYRGIVVSVFLKQFFKKYVEYDFTAHLEEDLDLISDGKVSKLKFLNGFWKDFESNVKEIMDLKHDVIFEPLNKIFGEYFLNGDLKCPKCGGDITLKNSRYGIFWGCSNYPKCDYIKPIDAGENNFSSGANEEFESKKYGKITIKRGQYGRYCEFNKDGKIKKCSIPDVELTEDILNFYLELPFSLGKDNDGNDVKVGIGKFGPYVLNNGKFYSCKFKPFHEISLTDALEVILEKNSKPKKSFVKKSAKKTTAKSSKTTKKTKTKTTKSK